MDVQKFKIAGEWKTNDGRQIVLVPNGVFYSFGGGLFGGKETSGRWEVCEPYLIFTIVAQNYGGDHKGFSLVERILCGSDEEFETVTVENRKTIYKRTF